MDYNNIKNFIAEYLKLATIILLSVFCGGFTAKGINSGPVSKTIPGSCVRFDGSTTIQDIEILEVSKADYEVYSSFFGTEKLPKIDLPQFFDDAVKIRRVYERTLISKVNDKQKFTRFKTSTKENFVGAFEDYVKNNSVEYLIKDQKILPELSILTKEQKEKRTAGQFSEVPSQLTGEYAAVSRVGFNKARNLAFLRVDLSSSFAASYYVLMQKEGEQWLILKVEMEDLKIF